jgi:hypothetical protein
MNLPRALQAAYQADPRRRRAASMIQAGTSTAPVSSHLQGLARALQAGIGQYQQNRIDTDFQRQSDQYRTGLAEALNAQTPEARYAAISSMGPAGDWLRESMVKQKLTPSPTVSLPPGGVLLDQRTGKVLHKAPPAIPAGSQAKSEERLAQDLAVAKARAGERIQTAEEVALAESMVKKFGALGERADRAVNALDQLRALRAIKVKTGAFAPIQSWASSIVHALNGDPEALGLTDITDATGAQQFEGIVQNLVLEKMLAQKGPQTSEDARRIERTLASIKNTPEAKDFLLSAAIATESRALERHAFHDDWLAKNKTLKGADRAWAKYIAKTPLVGRHPKSQKVVFLYDFRELAQKANPSFTQAEIDEEWRKKYRWR